MTEAFNLISSYRRNLEMKLDPMRYEHSLSVSYTCMNLAMRYGYDMEKAELAGLLHDCGKRYSDDIILKKCRKHNISFTPEEEAAPAVLHANYGAWLAQNKYGIQDPEILSAILYHTTGRPEMSMLEKIVYIADYIEPRRYKAADLPQMRKLAYIDLDETMYEILKGTLAYLNKKSGKIDPMTRKAFDYYQELHRKSVLAKELND
ncbi:MAG: bis(5'-nucleosyl)-tetraphosphatase (symmetrical) YqeK [Lachnospiraceae bacterium]|nr:bis(5'-nucleosyl)-tetraphosphatase (symmetrical) YqeK [Lachnospiraceae bacterium]